MGRGYRGSGSCPCVFNLHQVELTQLDDFYLPVKTTEQAVIRATRARPSLLAPLAGGVGVGLRCLAQVRGVDVYSSICVAQQTGAYASRSFFPRAHCVMMTMRQVVPSGQGQRQSPLARGVLGAVEETLDDCIRSLIQQQQQHTTTTKEADDTGSPAAAVKAFVKARRDGLELESPAAGAGDVAGRVGAEGGRGDPLAQGAQLLCRALLKGAERL